MYIYIYNIYIHVFMCIYVYMVYMVYIHTLIKTKVCHDTQSAQQACTPSMHFGHPSLLIVWTEGGRACRINFPKKLC